MSAYTPVRADPLERFLSRSMEQPTSAIEAERWDKAEAYMKINGVALLAATQHNDAGAREAFFDGLRMILEPQISPWFYPFAFALYMTTFAIIPPVAIYMLYPNTSVIVLSIPPALAVMILRFYFTFRSRILARLGVQERSHYALLRIITVGLIGAFAIGDPAFCAAPLAQSWARLTGRERAQPGWQRDLILVLILILNPIYFGSFPLSLLFLCIRSLQTITGSQSTLALVAGCVGVLLYLVFCPLSIFGPRLSLFVIRRLARQLGYHSENRSDFVRGFTDQMLATHSVPNPTRDRELEQERLAAEAQALLADDSDSEESEGM